MKLLSGFVPLVIVAATAVSSVPLTRGTVNEALVPQFGISSGVNPSGTGDCDGAVANGKPVKIPCSCPPDRATFIKDLNANVAAGHVINNPSVKLSFPKDGSKASQLARINAAIVTLQNLNGKGKGCPVASTTFLAQQAAINDAGTHPALLARQTAPSPSLTPAQVDALAPQLGFTAGQNPSGTGNCDGAVNGANGLPIQVPCTCPPDQATFDQSLLANANAGHAVNNPSLAVSFPLDDSVASQLARIDAAIVTLQNLNGPGQGCPAASTTFSAQQAALLQQQ